ncbi:hypothetical protein [Streptomyces sp. NPDC000983]|uniref:hypothetical protein n=1 Tax=Streptomyces sp. NPDC000983 TaxID=3154373 RepID=UPI00332468E0
MCRAQRVRDRGAVPEPGGDRPDCDSEVLEFVFARPPGTTNTSGLPRRTTLQKTLLNHLDQGGHWHMGRGWTPLP